MIMKRIGISNLIIIIDLFDEGINKLGEIICNKDAILRHSLKEPFRATVDIGGHRFFPFTDERVLL